jgi:F-type H+-transporting ATPase subunit epsilon
MAEPLHFDLVAPDRLLLSEEVESVMVPGSEGFFTVFARHAPFMSTLKPGLLEVKPLSGGSERYYVRGGFADVTPSGLTILADSAIHLSELDPSVLAQEIRDAEEDVADAGADQVKRQTAEKKLQELRDVERSMLAA